MDISSKFQAHVLRDGDTRDGTQLVQRVTDILRKMIMEGELPPETQLPNEPELSVLLNVSRTTMRSALAILEQAGFIQRRWGVGTFVSKNPPTYNNLSLNSGVTQLIRSSGAEPGCTELLLATRPANERLSTQLAIEEGSLVLVIERVRLANEQRAVFTVDFLPMSLFDGLGEKFPLLDIEDYLEQNQSMYGFLRQHLALEIHHGLAWIRPLSAEQYLADKLQIPMGSSVLHIEQVDFDPNGGPVALSDEYYVPDAFRFYIYRSNQGA